MSNDLYLTYSIWSEDNGEVLYDLRSALRDRMGSHEILILSRIRRNLQVVKFAVSPCRKGTTMHCIYVRRIH